MNVQLAVQAVGLGESLPIASTLRIMASFLRPVLQMSLSACDGDS